MVFEKWNDGGQQQSSGKKNGQKIAQMFRL